MLNVTCRNATFILHAASSVLTLVRLFGTPLGHENYKVQMRARCWSIFTAWFWKALTKMARGQKSISAAASGARADNIMLRQGICTCKHTQPTLIYRTLPLFKRQMLNFASRNIAFSNKNPLRYEAKNMHALSRGDALKCTYAYQNEGLEMRTHFAMIWKIRYSWKIF